MPHNITPVKESQSPLFSIITVTYNAADSIEATLESVACQDFTDYEHIIVDGASTDDTLTRVKSLRTERTVVNSEPDHGIYDAMNRGIGMSNGRYLIFLNSGDRLHSSDTLSVIAKSILSNDEPGVVYGATEIVDIDGHYLGPRHLKEPKKLTYKSFATGMTVCHQAFVALKRLVPLYDTNWRFSADYEWCIRVLQHSRHNINTHTVLIDYLAEGMTTRNRSASLKERFKIMCRYYGTVPTVIRHIHFAARFAVNRLRGRSY